MNSLPKLSYVLLSHNREAYIRQAVESAFAQDYEGELEYIFSDDCSTDRTFDILQECVAAYKGPRRVVLTQTPRNLHLAGHTNHAVQFVTSDWIVRADDDDLSAVDRCTLIGKAIAAHPKASMIFGKLETFTDEEEKHIRSRAAQKSRQQPDITESQPAHELFYRQRALHQTWSMEHFRTFGPLPADGYWVDDLISCYRCALLGSGVELDATLVYVRTGSNNMSRGGDTGRKSYRDILRQELFSDNYQATTRRPLQETLQQLRNFCGETPSPEQTTVLEDLNTRIAERELLAHYWKKSTLERLRIRRQRRETGLFSLLRCMPLPVFATVLTAARILLRK